MVYTMSRHAKSIVALAAIILALGACALPPRSPVPQAAPSTTALPGKPSSTPTPSPAAGPGSRSSHPLVLANGTLIDGSGAAPIQDALLVIQDGRIIAVGPRSAIVTPEGAEVIDVLGSTILPGFINTHVHGAYNLDKLAAWTQEGVTSVRDLGSRSVPAPFSIRQQASLDAKYARLVAAGPFITAPKGYPIAVFGGQAVTVSTPDEARQAVNDLLDQGADVIKIGLESGDIFGQALPMLSPDTVIAIVETAHQRQTLVAAHVTVARDLKMALDYGVDDVVHMITDPLTDDLIERMVANDIYWEPTIELWKNVGHDLDRHVLDNLGRYAAAGGKVALGTDYEGYYTPFQLGMPMHELEWMQEAGMSPMQIIIASTKNAAFVCGIQDLGTLEVGKIADVLVVQGDPLQDIHTLANVKWVIHNGVVIRSPD